jgi:hypothetical protein
MDIEKYRGTVVWIELFTGERVDRGAVERAIRRGDELLMDMRGGAGEFAVTLRRKRNGRFVGTWIRDRGAQHGTADGQLTPRGDGTNTATLLGNWDSGTVMWGCVLEAVDSF